MLGAGKDGGGAGGGLMAGAAETKATPLPLPSGACAPVVPGQEPVSALVRATQKQQGPVSVESLPPLGTGGGGAGGVAEADRCLNEMPLLRGVSMQIGRGPSLLMLPVAASDQALMTEYYTRVPPQKGVSVLMPETSEIPVAAAAEGEEGGPEGPAAAPPAAATAVGAGPAGMLAAHPPSEGGPALPPSAAAPPTAIAAGAGAAPAAGAAAAAESAEKQKKAAAVKEAETREYTADEHLMTIAALSERYGTKVGYCRAAAPSSRYATLLRACCLTNNQRVLHRRWFLRVALLSFLSARRSPSRTSRTATVCPTRRPRAGCGSTARTCSRRQNR